MTDTIDWNNLIALSLGGDQNATGKLIEETQDKLYQYCLYLSGNQQLAEDISHDAYVSAITSLKQLKQPKLFVPWLKQIARNRFLDHVRSAHHSKSHCEINETNLGHNHLPEDLIDAIKSLMTLTEVERSLVILIEVQGHTYDEAGVILKMTETAVRSKLHRLRQKLIHSAGETNAATKSS